MPAEPASAAPDLATRAMIWVEGLAALLIVVLLPVCVWSGFAFTPPYAWIADLEVALFGAYWEPSVVLLLGIAWCYGAFLVMRRVPALPALPALPAPPAGPNPWARGWNAILGLALAAVMLGLPMKAWQVVARLPRADDPVQVVDLDRPGGVLPPFGKVRVLGVPDFSREATRRYWARARNGPLLGRVYSNSYAPVIGRQRRDTTGPVRIVVKDYGRPTRAPTGALDGILIPDGVGGRGAHALRRRSIRLAEPTFLLAMPHNDPRGEAYATALILMLIAVSFWVGAVHTLVTARRARRRPAGASPAPPMVPPPMVPPPMVPPPMVPPPMVPAAPVVLPSMRALHAPPGAALLCVLRDQPWSGRSVCRVDVDGAPVADLRPESYTVAALRPGPHVLAANDGTALVGEATAPFAAAAGEVVVYRLHVPVVGRSRLEPLADLAAARATLARLQPVPPVPSAGQARPRTP